jgi:hypothetical protein
VTPEHGLREVSEMSVKPVPGPDPAAEEDDPLVTEYVERALHPIRDKMPPEDLEVFRQRMYIFYETNPEAVQLLNEIRDAKREPAVVGKSADIVRRDDDALAAAAARKRTSGDGK